MVSVFCINLSFFIDLIAVLVLILLPSIESINSLKYIEKEGYIKKVEVDTSHFAENYPYYCSLEGCEELERADTDMDDPEIDWIPVLDKVKLQGNTKNAFVNDIIISGKFTHVRLKMYPDGGISRLRLWGEL